MLNNAKPHVWRPHQGTELPTHRNSATLHVEFALLCAWFPWGLTHQWAPDVSAKIGPAGESSFHSYSPGNMLRIHGGTSFAFPSAEANHALPSFPAAWIQTEEFEPFRAWNIMKWHAQIQPAVAQATGPWHSNWFIKTPLTHKAPQYAHGLTLCELIALDTLHLWYQQLHF